MDNVFKISDDRFSVENIDQYELVIEFNFYRFQFIIRHHETKMVLWLEDYFIDNSISIDSCLARLTQIINNHAFLSANFWHNVIVNFSSPYVCLVPPEIDINLSTEILKTSFPNINFDLNKIITQNLKANKGSLVLAFPSLILDFFDKHYQTAEHNTSEAQIINYYLSNNNGNGSNYLIFSDAFVSIISNNSNGLSIEKIPLQSHKLENFLKIFLKDKHLKNTIYGEITPYSVFYTKIKEISPNPVFGKYPLNAKLTQFFDDLPEHRYLALFID